MIVSILDYSDKRGSRLEWQPHVDKLIIEWLANHTPPTCIQKNILAMARSIHTDIDIVRELPSLTHIRNMCTVLASVSKTLAVCRLAKAPAWKQIHTDETSRTHTSLVNAIVSIADSDGVFRTICLSSNIMAQDGTAEEQACAIIASFQEFKNLLDDWREVTVEMYPNRLDLLNQIPSSDNMCISKMLGSMITTDTCPTALLLRPKLIQKVYQYCCDELKMFEAEITPILEGDCWQHMRNIICNGIDLEMRSHLTQLLEDDLSIIQPHLRVKCDLDNICRMCDKEFNGTANYTLGHGRQFMQWMETHRGGELLIPIVRALGGKRMDGSFEGSFPVYMGRHHFVAFLHDFLCSTDSSNILQHNLFITLSCVELIAQLRVASIFFVAYIIPMRWLAGKTHTLAHRN